MDRPQPKKRGEINFNGDVSGQVAIGDQNTQIQSNQRVDVQITEADLQELHSLVEALKQQIITSAAPELKDQALERASELEEAITAQKPDLTTMEYVRDWFTRHLPQLAGAVTTVVVDPLVGKIVEASGEVIAHEFKRRFRIP